MARKETRVQRIVRLTAKHFPSFGNGTNTEEIFPSSFKAGVRIGEVVRFVLAKQSAIESAERQKIGDDARDYINTSIFLNPLSNKALAEIAHLGRNEIHRRLRDKTYPFSRLDKKTRETLLHLPSSWVHGAANWLLDARRTNL